LFSFAGFEVYSISPGNGVLCREAHLEESEVGLSIYFTNIILETRFVVYFEEKSWYITESAELLNVFMALNVCKYYVHV
jgi:hypothetical protein